MNSSPEQRARWHFLRKERIGLAIGLLAILAFGANLEHRTALRRQPMTDLAVFSCSAWAVWNGDNVYNITDMHGWHYQYPPAMAILFVPFAHPLPPPLPDLAPGEKRTEANTPWGYIVPNQPVYFGLHAVNARFFWIVAAWYLISVVLIFFSAHVLACVLESRALGEPPPREEPERRRWWALRLWPILVCGGSWGTDLSRGQVDILMLSFVALGVYLAVIGRFFTSGMCLSFPACVKLFPAFILLYPIRARRLDMAAGVITGLLLFLAVLPAVTLGPNRTVELYRDWAEVLAKPALGYGTDTSRAIELTDIDVSNNQSLLAVLHSWTYLNLRHAPVPRRAAAWERDIVYGVTALLFVGLALVCGLQRRDSRNEFLIVIGLLIGLALVASPIVHEFYFLLAMPLIAALVDRCLTDQPQQWRNWKLLAPLALFMVVDFTARLPIVGDWLVAWGIPLLSLLYLMVTSALLLAQRNSTPSLHRLS